VKPTCKNRSLKTTAKCRAKCCRSNRSQQRRDVTAEMSEGTHQSELFIRGSVKKQLGHWRNKINI